jgi:hypothetical protein
MLADGVLKGHAEVLMKLIKLKWIAAFALVAMTHGLSAQSGKEPPSAPAPAQITAAHKVFVSNGGGEIFETGVDQRALDGGPDRSYNEFYADLKSWGHFEFVSVPSDADLVLQISCKLTDSPELSAKTLGRLKLLIIDPKTNVRLWTITEFVRGAMLLGNRDKNFDQAMRVLVNRLTALANQPSVPRT